MKMSFKEMCFKNFLKDLIRRKIGSEEFVKSSPQMKEALIIDVADEIITNVEINLCDKEDPLEKDRHA